MFIKKFLPVLTGLIVFCVAANSQALFTYGTNSVSKDEFLKAFNKNPDTTGSRAEKLKQYMDMYINFKLKIKAAKDEKLDQGQMYKSEAEDFRSQLTDNYIDVQADLNALVQQAFRRSQKDIMIANVFVEVKPGEDTSAAFKQITQAYNALKSGKEFGQVAADFSSDENTKNNKGYIGYITVFTLPYEIENEIYGLQAGEYSTVYRSIAGYHIFKNISERLAAGSRKIQQILMATPKEFTDDEQNAVAKLADSVYGQLQKGVSFDEMIQQYGANTVAGGAAFITEVKTGQYSTDFEEKVFALQNKGEISKPFLTSYGYNIIKLVEKVPVISDESDIINKAHLQELVQQDNRLAASKDALTQKWMVQTKYTPSAYNKKDLWLYTDSSLKKSKPLITYKNLTPQTILFSFAKQKVTVNNWLQFVAEAKQTGTPYAQTGYENMIQEFTKSAVNNYYRRHIEDYYPPIAGQVAEFNEANLLFAVMDKHVWSKAAEDTLGLRKYYGIHKQQYNWQPGVTALVISSASKEMVQSVGDELKTNGTDWRNIISKHGEAVLADSSRFEIGQLPVKQQVPMQKGFVSAPEDNESSDSYTVVYVFETFPQISPRNFDDARGMVINDYQQQLEEKWVAELKKKYPVRVNDAVAKQLR